MKYKVVFTDVQFDDEFVEADSFYMSSNEGVIFQKRIPTWIEPDEWGNPGHAGAIYTIVAFFSDVHSVTLVEEEDAQS